MAKEATNTFRVTTKRGKVVGEFKSVQAAWRQLGTGAKMTGAPWIAARLKKLGYELVDATTREAPVTERFLAQAANGKKNASRRTTRAQKPGTAKGRKPTTAKRTGTRKQREKATAGGQSSARSQRRPTLLKPRR